MENLQFCCDRFKKAVDLKEINHADENDETEWFIGELWHLYYCPFCGAFIKGKGFGNYDKKYPPNRSDR